MTRALTLLIILLWAGTLFSTPQTGNQVLEALSRFNPATVIAGYTANPKEASLASQDKEGLKAQALSQLKNNETAAFIHDQAKSRARVRPNAKASELQYAEALLEQSGKALDGRCYEVKAGCAGAPETRTCQEEQRWQTKTCGKTLEIRFKPQVQTIERFVAGISSEPYALHLTTCDPYQACSGSQQLSLNPDCHHLSLAVSDGSAPVQILNNPTCQNPVAVLEIAANAAYGSYLKTLHITVTQWLPEDHWVREACNSLKEQVVSGQCWMAAGEACVDANQSRLIEGYPLTRPCWGLKTTYHCQGELLSNCAALMAAGCSQSNSQCTHTTAGFCDQWQQTFRCASPCSETRLICPGQPHCADGSCDKSEAESSNDIQEGLAGLAALAGSASGIAETADSLKPNAFAGSPLTCKKTIVGVRDCCRDRGWGDWVVHCPASMQDLMKARQENRTVYLGSFKDGLEKTHVYCVFPSLLAAIVQREGRGLQLGLSFGTAKAPDCRGISAEELAALHFDAMDFTPLTQAIQAQLTLPDAGKAGERLKAAVEGQYKEKSHD